MESLANDDTQPVTSADDLTQLVEIVAVRATKAGVDQQRAEVAGIEQLASVCFRLSGGA